MLWIVSLVLACLLMSFSDKALGNPLAFLGVGYLGFCIALLGGVVLRVAGMTLPW